MAERLTEAQRAELQALARFNDRLGGPFFTMRCNYRGSYARFVRRGLIAWTDPPAGFSRRMFAGVEITPAGRAAIVEDAP